MQHLLLLYEDITLTHIVLFSFCGILIGSSKAGLSGVGMIVVPVMAYVFGGKVSAGMLLPALVMGDAFAVIYYNQHSEWKYIIRLIPWTVVGIVGGMFTGNIVSDVIFKEIMAVTILVCVVLMLWRDYKKNSSIPDHWALTAFTGLAGGFATMIGNSAGPILTIFLLSLHLPKNKFIGTKAWFFLIINIIKVPFHVFSWHTITLKTLSINLLMFPAIIMGAFIGIAVVKIIPEKLFRILVIVVTVLASVLLFF